MLKFHYFADVKKTLYDKEYEKSLALMKNAGVGTLWLFVSMTGRYLAECDEIIAAKRKLEDMGFETGALILPVGHPGNSLNPEEEIELSLPRTWNYRVGADGNKEYFCACIDEVMTADNKKTVEFCREVGFTRLFFDDDLRLGNHGNRIRGCFCDRCLEKFARVAGKYYLREELSEACESGDALSEQWIDFNCKKLTNFMSEMAIPDIQIGIMVMHRGGRYHGIDIPSIKKAVPDCMFRVGELHFDDNSFEGDVGHADELDSMKTHMALAGDRELCYSETTVYPAKALSPENLIKKAELAIGLGIKNIFLMSGTWVMTDEYWHALAKDRERLEGFSNN